MSIQDENDAAVVFKRPIVRSLEAPAEPHSALAPDDPQNGLIAFCRQELDHAGRSGVGNCQHEEFSFLKTTARWPSQSK
jgi:hypothetical protein